MATKNIVPNADSEGGIGTSSKYWATGFIDAITTTGNLVIGGSIDLEGAIDVNGTTNLDIVDIDGAVNIGAEVTLVDANKIIFNDASQFIHASSDAILNLGATDEIDLTATAIDVNGTMDVSGAFTNGSTLVSTGKITADAGIDIDNINIDGTTIALSSGHLTLDLAAQLIIDADDEGSITLKNSGTSYGLISSDNTAGDFKFKSVIQDKDIVFQGNDGGTGITALTLDMSAAGAATFNGGVTIGESTALNFGGRGAITQDGSYNFTWSTNGVANGFYLESATGNVGIGNTSPAYRLDVESVSDSVAGAYIQAGKSSQGEIQNTGLIVGSRTDLATGDYLGVSFSGNATTPARGRGAIGVVSTNGPNSMDLVFMTRNAVDGTQLGTADEKMRIASGGDITVKTGNLVIGTAGKGIDFTQAGSSASGSANALLDDYEEGSWDGPRIRGSGTVGVVEDAGTVNSYYTKIGDMVFAYIQIKNQRIANATGDFCITGLPFALDASDSVVTQSFGIYAGLPFTSGSYQYLYINQNRLQGYQIAANGGGAVWGIPSGTVTYSLDASITYKAAL